MIRCPTCGHENRAEARFCDACGTRLQPPPSAGEQRKTVTVMFCDVTGSTALGERLDPESLRAVMARYFELARGVVERHGGTVEKFIGDAVMAVFGIPVLHEDDAIRAVRAAAELRGSMTGLNETLDREFGTTLELRIGVNTGQVVVGTAERLATGDAVNVTARLEQAAAPGEVLIGPETYDLVRDLVVAEPTEPLTLKGKAQAIVAYRLESMLTVALSRRHSGAMVGRRRELDRIRDALSQATADRTCQLFTILGAAGVGKSRLVAEFLSGLADATVVRGACLSYGEGITYWPVAEVLRQLLGSDPEARLSELGLAGTAARAVRAILDPAVTATVDEITWALRSLLEAAATDRPLVVVFDDIHWGADVFLDLVDNVADLSRNAPILLLCMARPDLLDRRPSWGGGKLNATTVLLEPLGASDAELLVESLLDGPATSSDLRARILAAAEGNPLFVEEMIALIRDAPDSAIVVPPTIQALLAARLDQLDPAERIVLERGSIEGRVFHRGAVQAMSPGESSLTTPITALIRRELLRPDRAQLPGEDAFRFRHLLIRDAAYEALPKAVRAELHERFASWIESRGADLAELDEIVGYHLERAYRYRVELGPPGARERALGERAAERLGAAGSKASTRGDVRAATNLLGRAVDLFPPEDPRRLVLLPVLGSTLHDGGEWDRAEEVLAEAVKRSNVAGDRRTAAYACVARTQLWLFRAAIDSHDQARHELSEAVGVFEELRDQAGLARALGIAGQMRFWKGEATAALADLELAADHARDVGDRLQEVGSLHYLLLAAAYGPMPARDALELCERIRRRVEGHGRLEVTVLRLQGFLHAIQGEFEPARRLLADAFAQGEALGLSVALAGVGLEAGRVELLDGDAEAALSTMQAAYDRLSAIGDRGHLVTIGAVLADAMYVVGRMAEADAILDVVDEWAIEDDLDPQIGRRRVRAKLLARHGELDDAERLAREAVELAAGTEFVIDHAHAREDHAEVLLAAGRVPEAVAELRVAIGLFERKGDLVERAAAQARLAGLETTVVDR